MIDISFKDDVMYYSGIPFNLYGIIGIFKMFNYSFNPSVWSSGLNEMGIEYIIDYSVKLSNGDNNYLFDKNDLFVIKNWLKENHKEWYDLLPTIDSQIKE